MPTASVLERLSSRNSPRNNLITIVTTGGVILVLLFMLLTIALPALEVPLTEDDSPSLELGSITWYLQHVITRAVPFALELTVVFGFLRQDHLKAHIGEKRLPACQMPALGKVFFTLAYSGRHFC